MLDQFVQPNHLRSTVTYSAVSRVHEPSGDTYEIHLVKAGDPEYIPRDLEVWPIYHQTILTALTAFPEAHQAAIAAVRQTQQRIKGHRNAALPPGTKLPY